MVCDRALSKPCQPVWWGPRPSDCRNQDCHGVMRQIAVFAAAVLVVGVLAVRMIDQRGQAPPATMAAQPAPAPTGSPNSRSVTLSRGQGGQFWTEARVDG